jgi:hypothetical protein
MIATKISKLTTKHEQRNIFTAISEENNKKEKITGTNRLQNLDEKQNKKQSN